MKVLNLLLALVAGLLFIACAEKAEKYDPNK